MADYKKVDVLFGGKMVEFWAQYWTAGGGMEESQSILLEGFLQLQLSSNWELLAIYYNKDAFEGENKVRSNIVQSRKRRICQDYEKVYSFTGCRRLELAQPTDTRKIVTERSMATVKVKKVYITLSYLTGDSHVLQV
mgnify:CR=1 FL=1